MADPSSVCPHCGSPLPDDVLVCPTCHTPVDVPAPVPAPVPPDPEPETVEPAAPESTPSFEPPPLATPSDPEPVVAAAPPFEGRPAPKPVARRTAVAPANPFASELVRRLARVAQWVEGAEPLGVQVPKLPAWAEEAARTSWNPEPWAEAVRGIERIAQKRILVGFEEWQKRTRARLTRLEAYAVDSRLERDQIEDTLQNARRYYNAVVRDLNTRIEQFPSNLVANMCGFKTREFFEITAPAEREVPRVSFTTPAS